MATRNPDPNDPSKTNQASAHAPARSYRDIERVVTPLPDSSHRPTEAEAAEAELPRPIHVSTDGGATGDSVRAAIEALPAVDATDLELDVVGGSVRVAGSVARGADRDQIVAALHTVPGVTEVVDNLRVRLD
jgi:hypothetical protein